MRKLENKGGEPFLFTLSLYFKILSVEITINHRLNGIIVLDSLVDMEHTNWSATTPLRRAPTIQEGFFPPPTNRDHRGTKVPQLQEVLAFIIFVMMSVNACSGSMFITGENFYFCIFLFLQGKSYFVEVIASYDSRCKWVCTGIR